MPTNLEIKARIGNLAAAVEAARAARAADVGILRQTDTYFCVPHGRLKLREIAGAGAELIFYERDETGLERMSRFSVIPVPHPAPLREALGAALGVRGVVAKTRRLFMAGTARIHLDSVEGLGTFLEFEIPVAEDPREGHELLRRLQSAFGIVESDYRKHSYIDLLEQKAPAEAE